MRLADYRVYFCSPWISEAALLSSLVDYEGFTYKFDISVSCQNLVWRTRIEAEFLRQWCWYKVLGFFSQIWTYFCLGNGVDRTSSVHGRHATARTHQSLSVRRLWCTSASLGCLGRKRGSPGTSLAVAQDGEATDATERRGVVAVVTWAPVRASSCARKAQRKAENECGDRLWGS
jgi:hypothetical protein